MDLLNGYFFSNLQQSNVQNFFNLDTKLFFCVGTSNRIS